MKTAFLLLLWTASILSALADEPSLSPSKAIEQFGSVSITDGSSFYTFSKDGTFRSGPLGNGGRTFEGQWTTKDGRVFTAVAKLGWVNGMSQGDEYRRIVFSIFYVWHRAKQRSSEMEPVLGDPPSDLWDSYFLIDELVKVPEPAAPESK